VFICIIATQSVTAITFMFILIFWGYLGFNSKILKKISIISLILIVFSYVYIIHLGPSVDIKSGWETSAIDRKLNSFIFRVQPQINAMEMISTSERYYSGFGSGQSLVYFSRPFHNSYMQLIFDHGYIISCVLVFAVFFYSISIGHWPAFFSLLLSSLLFEHFFMMTVILYFFILRRCSIT
uniref:hypothetical protein n=1 Tax=Vibrio sp. V23_P3S9T160 TaxID=1938675 RepID=UPI001F23B438